MGAAALLSITLVPVLMGWFIRGKIKPEARQSDQPLAHPHLPSGGRLRPALAHGNPGWWPWWRCSRSPGRCTKMGSEFMPPLYEGDLLYMPTTLPGLSVTKAKEILQQTDRIIRQFPEVEHVFGKIGRAETATDPAPMMMIETTIMLKPEEEWRKVPVDAFLFELAGVWISSHRCACSGRNSRRITVEELTSELNKAIQFPGLTNAWTMPIKTRIDMLSTGIKTPVGIKIMGDDLAVAQPDSAQRSRRWCAPCPAPFRPLPSGPSAATISISTSTGRQRPATASASATSRRSSRPPSAA